MMQNSLKVRHSIYLYLKSLYLERKFFFKLYQPGNSNCRRNIQKQKE